eukprot:TRINITY_DN12124_c0_g1_i2.p1 TRINITY_DN12124_c0_g1~~TRINITY_DN12124_c0_g1_i2.p1  ORF type:complete len:261 (+),score=69.70 TRINITY_DN12124_c0_g1_i2:24-785(+)
MQDLDLGEVEEKDWKCATFKQMVDLTEKTDEVIKAWGEGNAASFKGNAAKIDEAVTNLLDLEKKARLGGDMKNTMRLALEILKLLATVEQYSKVVDCVELLMKRRAQAKSVQVALIKTAKHSIDSAPKDQSVSLIKRLRDICQGKLHVELEFAQLSVELSTIWENEGKIKDCADIMLDVQVETIGNMERVEKLKILLLQIRLNLDVKDYVRAAIMARKTTSRALSKPNSRLIKIKYFKTKEKIKINTHLDITS